MRILITGACSGIGYELGKKLCLNKHTVYMSVENDRQVLTLKNKCIIDNIEPIILKMDITTDDIKSVDNLIIDVLINQAGIGMGGSLLDMDIKYLEENYNVNIFSSFRLLQRVYKNMIKNNIDGKLFVTSSVAAYLDFPFLGCYTSSKASITMLCKSIRRELKFLNSSITISVIEPGAYHTGFNQVMIDNKEKYLDKNSYFYKYSNSINRLQRNLFRLIEKDNLDDLVDGVINVVEGKYKFIIRKPWYLSIFLKIYYLFFY